MNRILKTALVLSLIFFIVCLTLFVREKNKAIREIDSIVQQSQSVTPPAALSAETEGPPKSLDSLDRPVDSSGEGTGYARSAAISLLLSIILLIMLLVTRRVDKQRTIVQ